VNLPAVEIRAGAVAAGRAAHDVEGSLEYASALALFEHLAARGDARAARLAGEMLYYGETLFGPEVRQDKARAARWLGVAARGGNFGALQLLKRVDAAQYAGIVACLRSAAAQPAPEHPSE